MPFGPPPDRYRGTPARRSLAAGTVLWRVHLDQFEALSFNSRPANRHWGGGRFDCTPDEWYPFLYAGLSEETALAERLLRDLPFRGNGHKRTVPHELLVGRQLHALRVKQELTLISLISAPDLAAIRQEDWWLVDAEGKDYAFTRLWAHWLRQVAPWAQGLIWSSRRNRESAIVLFGDRCPGSALELASLPGRSLEDDDGIKFLNDKLAPYEARICPPQVRRRGAAPVSRKEAP
jgi:hypothetical protein